MVVLVFANVNYNKEPNLSIAFFFIYCTHYLLFHEIENWNIPKKLYNKIKHPGKIRRIKENLNNNVPNHETIYQLVNI